MVSHDLQSPLHTVVSFAKRLRKYSAGKLDNRSEKAIGYALSPAEPADRTAIPSHGSPWVQPSAIGHRPSASCSAALCWFDKSLLLNSPSFGGAAAVVGDGGYVSDRFDGYPRGLQGSDCRLSTGARSFDADIEGFAA